MNETFMNKQIRDLIDRATVTEYGVDNGFDRVTFDKEKFAELIVLECAKVCYNPDNEIYQTRIPVLYEANKRIKQHFGINDDN